MKHSEHPRSPIQGRAVGVVASIVFVGVAAGASFELDEHPDLPKVATDPRPCAASATRSPRPPKPLAFAFLDSLVGLSGKLRARFVARAARHARRFRCSRSSSATARCDARASIRSRMRRAPFSLITMLPFSAKQAGRIGVVSHRQLAVRAPRAALVRVRESGRLHRGHRREREHVRLGALPAQRLPHARSAGHLAQVSRAQRAPRRQARARDRGSERARRARRASRGHVGLPHAGVQPPGSGRGRTRARQPAPVRRCGGRLRRQQRQRPHGRSESRWPRGLSRCAA